MKRQILILMTVLALMATGAVFAQSTLNTPAPGPSQETKPGQTNNNLQNPGNPQMQQPQTPQNPPVRENGTVEGTAAESNARTDQTGTTTTTTGTVDNTTGSTTGTMNDMDQTATPPPTTPPTTTTTTETTTTTGSYNGTTTSATSDRLPNTASDLPSLALMGLLALSAGFALRAYAKRQA